MATPEAQAKRPTEREERKAWDRAIRRQEEKALANCYPERINAEAFDRHWQDDGEVGGAEQEVYLDSELHLVFKRNYLGLYGNWGDYLTGLELHNRYFSETPYTLEGFASGSRMWEEDGLIPYISQPLINFDPNKKITVAETAVYMATRGFRPLADPDAGAAYFHPEDRVIVKDLHAENIVRTAGGPVVIDAEIHQLAKHEAAPATIAPECITDDDSVVTSTRQSISSQRGKQ